jgi:hypothetical protein
LVVEDNFESVSPHEILHSSDGGHASHFIVVVVVEVVDVVEVEDVVLVEGVVLVLLSPFKFSQLFRVILDDD